MGYFDFTDTVWLRSPAILERLTMTGMCSVPVSWAPSPAGGSLPMLLGGSVYQTTPKEAYAPFRLGPATFQTSFFAEVEAEVLVVERLPNLLGAGPVQMWLPIPHTDEWLIPTGAKTTWTLSRKMPWGWGLLPSNFPPVVKVSNPRDLRASADTVLTRSATSPPSAGEYYVDIAANATEIETADLTASAGLHLSCLYYPVREWGGTDSNTWAVSSQQEINGMRVQLGLREHVPSRTYAGLD